MSPLRHGAREAPAGGRGYVELSHKLCKTPPMRSLLEVRAMTGV
jgi:hypothetical protein